MKNMSILLVCGFFFSCGNLRLVAQEQPDMPQPAQKNQWLQKFVGEWDTTSEGTMGPGQPPVKCQGTISSRMLGGFWLVNEMKAEVFGSPMTGIQTIGYNSQKKSYVGTWVDSMTDHIWQYEGDVDASGKKLVLEAEGPNFMAEGKLTKFRDAYEFQSDDLIIATSSMLGEDGKWITFMIGQSTRKK